MHALPAHQGEAPLKRVDRERGVHMKVAKEHACLGFVDDRALRLLASAQDSSVERRSRDLPIGLPIAAAEHDPQRR